MVETEKEAAVTYRVINATEAGKGDILDVRKVRSLLSGSVRRKQYFDS